MSPPILSWPRYQSRSIPSSSRSLPWGHGCQHFSAASEIEVPQNWYGDDVGGAGNGGTVVGEIEEQGVSAKQYSPSGHSVVSGHGVLH